MYRKNVTGQYLYFALVNATNGAALTGASVTGKRAIDGAAQGSVTGTITEEAGGQYKIALSQADTNGNDIGYLFTATNAIPVSISVVTTAGDPTDAVRFGLSALPNAAASAVGGLPLSVDTSGRVDVLKVNGTSQTARDLGASVLLSSGTGTGQLDFTSGIVKSNLSQILATALTETSGLLAGGFKQFFNIASPTSTMNTLTTVTTATNLTNAPTAGDLTATMKTSVTTAASSATPAVTVSDKTGFSLSSAGVQAVWDALTSALTTVGSIGKLIVTNLDAAITSRTKPADTQAAVTTVATVTNLTNAPSAGDFTSTMKTSLNAATPTVTAGTVSDKTGYSLATAPPTAAEIVTALAVPTANANADALLDRTDGVETAWSVRKALRVIAAATAGKLSGAATTTVVVRNITDSKDRITATVDADGNRSAITLDGA